MNLTMTIAYSLQQPGPPLGVVLGSRLQAWWATWTQHLVAVSMVTNPRWSTNCRPRRVDEDCPSTMISLCTMIESPVRKGWCSLTINYTLTDNQLYLLLLTTNYAPIVTDGWHQSWCYPTVMPINWADLPASGMVENQLLLMTDKQLLTML